MGTFVGMCVSNLLFTLELSFVFKSMSSVFNRPSFVFNSMSLKNSNNSYLCSVLGVNCIF